MIIEVFLFTAYVLLLAITSPFRILPDVETPALIENTIDTANEYIAIGNNFLPLFTQAIITAFLLFITIEVSIFLYKGIMWGIKKIPGLN